MKDENKYNPGLIEKKWQEVWEKEKTFSPDLDNAKNPYYNLMMFPYPSAEGLHVGNMYAFTGADVYARFNRMQGKDVFEPIGLDGFGIHSENYALKVGRHPMEQAEVSEKNFYRQMHSIGNSFDWQRTVETYDPDYYRWTQWLFIQMFKAGLAYRSKAMVNWCPSCKTVLSDEQVISGVCERCSSTVEKRELEQWFFRITNYAQKLLDNLETLDWTEKVKIAQKNWIGRSEGAVIEFQIAEKDRKIKVFTTRPDTLFGATFLVLSPEHSLVNEIESKEVSDYIKLAKSKTEAERVEEGKEKSGVFSGLYAINPVNNEKIPVWVADYVLMGYGTGAIMAVPAHDDRDFAFAKKYNLPIKEVIKSLGELPYLGDGAIVNSGEWNGLEVPEQMEKVLTWIEEKGFGKREITYHLRDWLISRQRYWGPPIPMIYCSTCFEKGKGEREEMPGWYSAPLEQLPVKLPKIDDYKPLGTGKSPLGSHEEFYKTKCPACHSDAVRETDVSDTFLDSAWYFFRYISSDIESNALDIERVKKWLPVNIYIGGAEHSVLHLLYSRFVTSVLKDLSFINFDEPFSKFFAHGLIIKDGAKMSKSKGNVVIPDEYIGKYGADTLRLYLMFLGPFSQGGDFRDSGIEGMNRFVRRVWKLLSASGSRPGSVSPVSLKFMHKTIKEVTDDVQDFKYNTAIAHMMEWYNFLSEDKEGLEVSNEEIEVFLKLLAPFAPHMTDELWHQMGNKSSIHFEKWPEFNTQYLVEDKVTVVVQVNGKRRAEVLIESSAIQNQGSIEDAAKLEVKSHIEGREVKKIIYVPGKIINFVI